MQNPIFLETSKCTKCGQVKPKTEFSKNSARPSGIQSWCKACHTANMKFYQRKVRLVKKSELIIPAAPLLSNKLITDIAVIPKSMGDSEIQTVNARELHEFLEVGRDFSNWIKDRSADYIENADYILLAKIGVQSDKQGGHNRIDYYISLDMAKELCMLERNAKGKQARQYFIEIEKKYKQLANKPMSMLDILANQIALLQQQEREMANVKQIQNVQQNELDKHTEELKEIKAKVITSHSDYYTVAGYANLRGVSLDIRQASMKGRMCAKLSKDYDYHIGKVKDERFGEVNTYHLDILAEVFNKIP